MVEYVSKRIEKIVGNRENASNQLFSLFQQHLFCFAKVVPVFEPSQNFYHLNPIPNDKIMDMIKLKAFADNKCC